MISLPWHRLFPPALKEEGAVIPTTSPLHVLITPPVRCLTPLEELFYAFRVQAAYQEIDEDSSGSVTLGTAGGVRKGCFT